MSELRDLPQVVAGLSLAHIDEETWLHESPCGHFHLHLIESTARSRASVENYIAEAYARAFEAKLSCFYPSIIVLHDEQEHLLGALGLRSARRQTLFLERYLRRPIECVIADHAGPTCRANIVEIGNLAISSVAQTYSMITLIGEWLRHYGIHWVTFSLTRSLRQMFQRAGVPVYDLGAARPERVSGDRNDWGSYYSYQPHVVAIPVRDGLARFQASRRTAIAIAACS